MTDQLVFTDDGSVTFYAPAYEDHYHSTKGALSEAMHIFIGCGFNEVIKKKGNVNILDVGFGTGLNALCTLAKVVGTDVKVFYTAIEAYPLTKDKVALLNYHEMLESEDILQTALLNMHFAPEMEKVVIHKEFVFRIFRERLEMIELSETMFDLIYFDPFKPESDLAIWSPEIFEKLFNATVPGGILVTYSSKGSVRRALQNAGFEVFKLPGPDGKREISRAYRPGF
jgi:tRNA U34 5-methylaminomethyl-2-thiouridine-forming methyltransferase MnmC